MDPLTGKVNPGANFMSKKLGVKISPGGISPNFVNNFPLAFLQEDRFLLDLRKIYSLLELMKLAPIEVIKFRTFMQLFSN